MTNVFFFFPQQDLKCLVYMFFSIKSNTFLPNQISVHYFIANIYNIPFTTPKWKS